MRSVGSLAPKAYTARPSCTSEGRTDLTSGHARRSDWGYGDPVQSDPRVHPKRPLAGGPSLPRAGELRLQSAPASLDPERPPPPSCSAHPASAEPVSDLPPHERAGPRP